ncbi:hypothetical protein [Maridesulfovibrio sp.]|uniref:hypothetical protein n=1 Tax=Maridesulfovibrio sp. TaxID=2795000 RepID=UPI002AA71B69|nr:hypothetical protein [Maridesulfovibrio sp.]
MKFDIKQPPRKFTPMQGIELSDCGSIELAVDEQVTFIDENNYSSDYTKKEWGYYLANSLNYRLTEQGFKTGVFISKKQNPPSIYVCTVNTDEIEKFNNYLKQVDGQLIIWLDEFDKNNYPYAEQNLAE